MMSGLQLLAEYNSETDEDEENLSPKRMKLPLPSSLNTSEPNSEVQDDPALHDGRSRSYPHQRGNWSSLIFIPYDKNEAFDLFCDQIIEASLPEVTLIKINEPHISLSRTFVLYYHWIQDFYISLKNRLKVIPSFEISFNGLAIYCNEETSRTFIALTVGQGSNELSSNIEVIDKCLQEYKLKPYYEDPSFHMSIAWCLGNKKEILLEKMTHFLKIFDTFEDSSVFSIFTDHLLFKTGYKEFRLEFKQV